MRAIWQSAMTGDAVDHGVGRRETRADPVVTWLAQHDSGDPRRLAAHPVDGLEGEAAAGRVGRAGLDTDEPVTASKVFVLCTVLATGTVALVVATMLANTGRRIARSTMRT